MAEAAVLGIAKSVLGQLGSPALKEALFLWNAKKDLKRLEDTTSNIVNILHDAERREPTEERVKGWLFMLRAVLYDIDDFFDVVAWRAERKKTMNGNAFRKEVRLFFSKSNQLGFIIKAAHDVKDLRERVEDIYKGITPFNFKIQPINESPTGLIQGRKQTHSFVKLGDVIGRERERDEIINLLVSKGNDEDLSVISVIGFGGIGKTALAQSVYNDERVQKGFDMCLWICINYLSDLDKVLVSILKSINPKSNPDASSLECLQKQLRKEIEGKKYLLVMDDVWDENELIWSVNLKPLLSSGKSGSKVLVTMRSKRVAQCFDAIKPYYELNVLSKESAWELFVKVAFEEGEVSVDDPELVSLGKEIVRKCGYVPLALITIGRMLRHKDNDKMLWLSIVEKELPQVLFSDDTGHDNGKIMQVLKFSYDGLPIEVKQCFAYCSVFPKDYSFDKDILIYMWMAQGFLKHPEKSLGEVGDEYFFLLIDRFFFQDVKMNTKEGCVNYSCKMHDLMHDLAILVAGNESRRFLDKDSKDKVRRGTTLRHMSVQCDPNFLLEDCGIASYSKTIRSLLFHDQTAQLTTKSLNSFFASLRMLRVLQLSSLEVEVLPNSLGELIHLRYLDLSKNRKLEVLPYSICKLHHLQTLILEHCWYLKELPSSLGKLVSLRHLLLGGCTELDSLPSGLAALASLVTLDRLIVHHRHGGLRYLGCLDNLCGSVNIELPVTGWSNCIEDARKSNMSRKLKLNGMIISWSSGDTNAVEDEQTMAAVLAELEPPKCIQYLKIKRYDNKALSSWFSSLANLKELRLVGCRIEYIDVSVRGGSSLFPCLEILEMKDLPNLKGWWSEVDNALMSVPLVLHRVSNLAIKNCPNLVESMPLFVSVKSLELSHVDGKLVCMLLKSPSEGCSSECHPYNSLEELHLMNIKGLECLPEGLIRQLCALKTLKFLFCDQLKWVSRRGLGYLTSLEMLKILDCGNVRLEDKDDEKAVETSNELGMPWKALRRLRILDMSWQSHLKVGLQYLTSLEQLTILYFQDKHVEASNALDMEGKRLLWNGLERLHRLTFHFNGIRCDFPSWIQNLSFVKNLSLCDCNELRSTSWAILANMQLERLSFEEVHKVMSVDDSVAKQPIQFSSLVQLDIVNVQDGQWVCDNIPWSLLPSLRTLVLSTVENLSGIPDGIQHLTSLQQLEIWFCRGIKAIPNWMINLKSLQKLKISGCLAEVEERCKPETGADWHLISHIPYKMIKEWW